MNDYTIEKNVPIPKKHGGKWRVIFDQMEDGDSIVFKTEEAVRFQASARHEREAYKRWDIRLQKQNNGTTRVWKVKRQED